MTIERQILSKASVAAVDKLAKFCHDANLGKAYTVDKLNENHFDFYMVFDSEQTANAFMAQMATQYFEWLAK